jgi:sugar phosphate isomerase/epimerase
MRRIGFRTAGFARWGIERTLRALRDIGYGSVELCLEHPETQPADLTPARCRQLAALLRELDLGLSSVSYHGDGRPSQERAENSLLAVEVAERMECPVLILNTMRREPGREEAQTRAAMELAQRLLAHSGRQVVLAFEPEPGLVISSAEDMLDFAARLSSPTRDKRTATPGAGEAARVAVNLDIGHAHITEPSAVAAIERLRDAIVHVHIEDIAGTVHRHLVPGEGEIDFAGVRGALDRIGYRGDYTVDMFALGDDPLLTAQQCFAAMQRWFV